jgi:ketosteroid isomerase-like protein
VSQENVELVRALIADTNQGGEMSLKGLHASVEWHLDSNHPDQRILKGHADVATYFAQWSEAFDEIRMQADDYLDRGDHVVMPFIAHGRLRGSASQVSLAETWVFEVRDGLIVGVREFLSTDEALKAVGLSE